MANDITETRKLPPLTGRIIAEAAALGIIDKDLARELRLCMKEDRLLESARAQNNKLAEFMAKFSTEADPEVRQQNGGSH